ncbi:MAG TPA: sulfite exporter TauE/SafE family protein [Gemmatimonadaceae bacterium]|nr:sulfite exporter TauE/SafE family protein [Gemmatimonadaceae bacterium]
MTLLAFAPLVALGAFFAGLLGSLTGLGGGIVIVPMLTLLFHVDLRYAIGASLISVIATSSGAAAAFVREGFTNVRVGILLEVATTSGALVGALLAGVTPTTTLSILFGLAALFTAYNSMQPLGDHLTDAPSHPWAKRLRLDSTYPTDEGLKPYRVQRVPFGLTLMFGAGALSALLGIGGGIIKVLAMDRGMRLPFKVSTTTSNFMIGVTASASAGVYLRRGYINPGIAAPVMLGVLAGALIGARILTRARSETLRKVFAALVVIAGIEMLYKGITGAM